MRKNDSSRKCFCCGKKIDFSFYNITDYTYQREKKNKKRYYCSWSCMSADKNADKKAPWVLRVERELMGVRGE